MASVDRIAVIGGGIGGLTVALAPWPQFTPREKKRDDR
jgi:hypothetical protein